MKEKQQHLTLEGIKKFQDELDHLTQVRMEEIKVKLQEARAQGDLSENAEYDAAKEEQAEIEMRIVELENMLKNATVIEAEDGAVEIVKPGYTVRLYDHTFEEEVDYLIVGSTEADPMIGKISNESPVGMALMNHKVGDIVEVETADGVDRYEILGITNPNQN